MGRTITELKSFCLYFDDEDDMEKFYTKLKKYKYWVHNKDNNKINIIFDSYYEDKKNDNCGINYYGYTCVNAVNELNKIFKTYWKNIAMVMIYVCTVLVLVF